MVEHTCVALARDAVRLTGLDRLALAGGVVSNIRATRRIRLLPEVEDVYVFPHMGDGGLAVGAARGGGRRSRASRSTSTLESSRSRAWLLDAPAIARGAAQPPASRPNRSRTSPLASPTCSPKAASSCGSRDAWSTARARWATAASSRGRTGPSCEIV